MEVIIWLFFTNWDFDRNPGKNKFKWNHNSMYILNNTYIYLSETKSKSEGLCNTILHLPGISVFSMCVPMLMDMGVSSGQQGRGCIGFVWCEYSWTWLAATVRRMIIKTSSKCCGHISFNTYFKFTYFHWVHSMLILTLLGICIICGVL